MTSRKLMAMLIVGAVVVALGQAVSAGDEEEKGVEYKAVFVPAVPVPAKQLGESEVEVDGPRFAKDIEEAVRELARDGFTVEATVPMVSGMYRWANEQPIKRAQSASASAYGYGYSVTSGVTIIARRG